MVDHIVTSFGDLANFSDTFIRVETCAKLGNDEGNTKLSSIFGTSRNPLEVPCKAFVSHISSWFTGCANLIRKLTAIRMVIEYMACGSDLATWRRLEAQGVDSSIWVEPRFLGEVWPLSRFEEHDVWFISGDLVLLIFLEDFLVKWG